MRYSVDRRLMHSTRVRVLLLAVKSTRNCRTTWDVVGEGSARQISSPAAFVSASLFLPCNDTECNLGSSQKHLELLASTEMIIALARPSAAARLWAYGSRSIAYPPTLLILQPFHIVSSRLASSVLFPLLILFPFASIDWNSQSSAANGVGDPAPSSELFISKLHELMSDDARLHVQSIT